MAILCLPVDPAAGEGYDPALAAEILRIREEWPEAEVEVPLELYRRFLLEALPGEGPKGPSAPANVASTTLHYQVEVDSGEAKLKVRYSCHLLDPAGLSPVRVLSGSVAWKNVQVNGKPAELRLEKGWLLFEPRNAGPFEITAETTITPERSGAVSSLGMPRPPTTITTVSVSSNSALEVTVARAAIKLVGEKDRGTHGTVGILPADELRLQWQPAWDRPERPPLVSTRTMAGFDVGERAVELRARLHVTLSGGATDSLSIHLPAGADRISVSGPDVASHEAGVVRLRGKVSGETRLDVSCTLPRGKDERIEIAGPSILGATQSGGEITIATDEGIELLESSAVAVEAVDPGELSGQARGLVPRRPVIAYRLKRGDWQVVVESVSMADFKTAETIVDDAAYTLAIRPDGSTMVHGTFTVRNRRQQFLGFQLPDGAKLVSARVAEQAVSPSRSRDGKLLVPMEKSVESVGGMVSFPLEMAYLVRAESFSTRGGRFRIVLPRPDAPVAYTRAAIYAPDEVAPGDEDAFTGLFRRVKEYGLEAAEAEFTYGRAYLVQGFSSFPGRTSRAVPYGEKKPVTAPDGEAVPAWSPDSSIAQIGLPEIQSYPASRARGGTRDFGQRGYIRAGLRAYEEGDFREAEEQLRKAVEMNPKSSAAKSARQMIDNIMVAKGEFRAEGKQQQAAQQQILSELRSRNVEKLSQQEALVRKAGEAAAQGRDDLAARYWAQARELAEELSQLGENVERQQEIMEEARERVHKYREAEERNMQLRAKIEDLERSGMKRREKLRVVLEEMKDIAPESTHEASGKDRTEDLAQMQADLKSLERRQEELEKALIPSPPRNQEWAGPVPHGAEPGLAGGEGAGGEQSDYEGVELRPAAPYDSDKKIGREFDEENIQLEGALKQLEESYRELDARLETVAPRLRHALNRPMYESETEGRPAPVAERPPSPVGQFMNMPLSSDRNRLAMLNDWMNANSLNWGTDMSSLPPRDPFGIGDDGRTLVYGGVPDDSIRTLVEALRRNRGLKLRVSSYNSSGLFREVVETGAKWTTGGNNVIYAIIDEGQVEALLERDALGGGMVSAFTNKRLSQETALGSQARLANGAIIAVVKADGASNKLVFLGNEIRLPHDKALAVRNTDGSFTLVRAGKVHAWGSTIMEREPFLVPAPRAVVPEVGRLMKLEKLFPRDGDEFTVEFTYSWKGE